MRRPLRPSAQQRRTVKQQMYRCAFMTVAPLAATLCLPIATIADDLTADSLSSKLRAMADDANAASVTTFGRSREGRPLWVLTLAAPGGSDPDDRTALLLTAGIDGDHLIGTSVAVEVAERLLQSFAAGDEAAVQLLTEHTVYVIPRVNPDAHERNFASHLVGAPYTVRPTDDDRDGLIDEDGPADLNGDGWVTMMRVKDSQATHLADKDHPRLMRKADRAKDERPVYKLYVEGLDDDGDGEYNEDPPGGVDLNANFPHGYVEHAAHAGPYQLSEPESRALVDFVLNHPHIAVAITFGRHNNLLEVDSSGKLNGTDKAPVELHEDDASIYKHMGERFKELTGIKHSPKPDSGGAFYAWAYAQHGIPSFATSVWHRPEPEQDDSEGDGESGDKKDDPKANASDDIPSERPDRPRRGGRRRGGRRGAKKEEKADPAEDIAEDIAWLKYSDDVRGGDGFVDWTAFDHPTLGKVELGGFKPLFKTTPPDDAMADLAKSQLKFLLDVGGRFPDIKLDHVEVIERTPNVFEIKALLRNDGYFPSGLEMAKLNRRVRPIVVTLDVPFDTILGGERVHRVWRVDGDGGAYELRWVVRGVRGQQVTVLVTSEKHGDFHVDVPLKPTKLDTTGGAK